MPSKFIWYTDLHLSFALPSAKRDLIRHILNENPSGIFFTGDISNGLFIHRDLKFLAKRLPIPIYFILGNHDYYGSSFEDVSNKIKDLCAEYPNLIWLTDSPFINITNDTAIVGTEGWYDAQFGDPGLLKYSFDWILIKEMRLLNNMNERIRMFRDLAEESCEIVKSKIEDAFQNASTVYLLTHFPPFKEAIRRSFLFEEFWKSYNVNTRLGRMLEDMMKTYSNKHLIVLAGHSHKSAWVHISKNLECRVNAAKYSGTPKNDELLLL